jgi:hypothetical protein
MVGFVFSLVGAGIVVVVAFQVLASSWQSSKNIANSPEMVRQPGEFDE